MSPTQRGARFFSLDALPAEPWRNGRGVTRTVARHEAFGETLWRISAADITEAGAFSSFEGLDREAVLVEGAGVTLRGPGGFWPLRRIGDIARFPGWITLHGAQDGARARLWNVMARRATHQICTIVRRNHEQHFGPIGQGALLVLEGAAQMEGAGAGVLNLQVGQGVVFEDWRDTVTLRFQDGPAHWLLSTFGSR